MDLLQRGTGFKSTLSDLRDVVGDMNILQGGAIGERVVSDFGDPIRDMDFRQLGTATKCHICNAGDILGDGRVPATEKQSVRLRLDDGVAIASGIKSLVSGRHLDGFDTVAGIEGILPDFRKMIGDDAK